jgi:hypothetical protein
VCGKAHNHGDHIRLVGRKLKGKSVRLYVPKRDTTAKRMTVVVRVRYARVLLVCAYARMFGRFCLENMACKRAFVLRNFAYVRKVVDKSVGVERYKERRNRRYGNDEHQGKHRQKS